MESAPSMTAPIIKAETNIKMDSSSIASPSSNLVSTVPLTTSSESGIKKETKNPVQIIRGGRVITLPPIEAPTTRSKRQQAKTETPSKIDQTPPSNPKVDPSATKFDRM